MIYFDTFCDPKLNFQLSKYDLNDVNILDNSTRYGFDSSRSSSPSAQTANTKNKNGAKIKHEKSIEIQQLNSSSNTNSMIENTSSNKQQSTETIPDLKIINILNQFVFLLFLIFILGLNIFGLIILPYFIRKPLSLDDA